MVKKQTSHPTQRGCTDHFLLLATSKREGAPAAPFCSHGDPGTTRQICLFLSLILANSSCQETEHTSGCTLEGRGIPIVDGLLSSQVWFLISLMISFLLLTAPAALVTVAGIGTPCSLDTLFKKQCLLKTIVIYGKIPTPEATFSGCAYSSSQ